MKVPYLSLLSVLVLTYFLFTWEVKKMYRNLRYFDKLIANRKVYSDFENIEAIGECFEFMCKHRKKYHFHEKMLAKGDVRLKQFMLCVGTKPKRNGINSLSF